MLQPRGNSAAIILLLILFIFIFFVSQAAMQKGEEIPPSVPQGGDLAVIGGSTAAMIAALEGVRAGAQVFLFPNGAQVLDDISFLVSGGLAAASTPPQEGYDITFTAEDLKDLIQEKGKGVGDPQLLEAFAREAEDLYYRAWSYGGIEFDNLPEPLEKPYLHLPALPGAGDRFRGQLMEKANKVGVLFRPEMVRRIVLSREEGTVEGILLENKEGKQSFFHLQGVILADGGYSGDIPRRHEYLPRGNLLTLRPEQTGEGIKLALELQAALVQTGYLHKSIFLVNPREDRVQEYAWKEDEETFFFNSEGQVLSGMSLPEECADFILRSPEEGAYVLVSEEIARQNDEFFLTFETMDELMEHCKLPDPPLFPGRSASLSSYHIAAVKAGVTYTSGGLSITPRGEVRNQAGEIIGGLFAAGEITGGLHGEGMLPGMALSETLFSAGRAGRAAAEYARR